MVPDLGAAAKRLAFGREGVIIGGTGRGEEAHSQIHGHRDRRCASPPFTLSIVAFSSLPVRAIRTMPYSLPTFNLAVNIWRNAAPPPAPPAVVTFGNLTPGKRTIAFQKPANIAAIDTVFLHFLLLPAHTDIRADVFTGNNDIVEVPAGTGRYYTVSHVEDVGKGFPNEHRMAWVEQDHSGASGLPWPYPTP